MRWKPHVRFGARARETYQLRAGTAPWSDPTSPTRPDEVRRRAPDLFVDVLCVFFWNLRWPPASHRQLAITSDPARARVRWPDLGCQCPRTREHR